MQVLDDIKDKNLLGTKALFLFLFLSGFAGLGYEMVWVGMLSVGLGHEAVSMLAVVAAFFCGTAVGAWALDGRVSSSSTPGRWYAALEAIVGMWSLVLIALIPWVNRFTPQLIGVEPSATYQWTMAFTLPFFVLLPATFAMGGTLPALEGSFRGCGKRAGRLAAFMPPTLSAPSRARLRPHF